MTRRPGSSSQFRYRCRLAMYCTTPSGTRYQTGWPAPTRSRQARRRDRHRRHLDQARPRRPAGGRRRARSPGRVTPTKCASSNIWSASFQDRIFSSASAPVMKNSSAFGPYNSAQVAQRVDGVGRAVPVDVDPADPEPRVGRGRDHRHQIAVLGRADLRVVLLPRLAGRHEDDLVEREPVGDLARRDQVTVVDRVERAAHDADPASRVSSSDPFSMPTADVHSRQRRRPSTSSGSPAAPCRPRCAAACPASDHAHVARARPSRRASASTSRCASAVGVHRRTTAARSRPPAAASPRAASTTSTYCGPTASSAEHHRLDLARIDVDAPDDQHVVGAADDLAHLHRGALAGRRAVEPGQVAGAVPQQRQRLLGERGERQLAQLAVRHRPAGRRIERLDQEVVLLHVQPAVRVERLAGHARAR